MWRRRPETLIIRSFYAAPVAAGGCGGGVAVKRVTHSNFLPALESLRRLVRDADFVAVDLEMTGVASAPWRGAFECDRADVRYSKLRDSAEKFAAVQLGVCPFRWDPHSSSFIANPHNIFVYHQNRLPLDRRSSEFLCQTSSIEFLSKHQFDFNACINEGVSYLSRAHEKEAIQKLYAMYRSRMLASVNSLDNCVDELKHNTADLLFIEKIKGEFTIWHQNIQNCRIEDCLEQGYIKACPSEYRAVLFKMHPAVILDGYTTHQLKLIQLVVREHFKNLIYLQVVGEDGNLQRMVVHTKTIEDKECLMRDIQEDLRRSAEDTVKSAAGIRHIIDLLSSEKKLIVGHNCFLDIAHIYGKFCGPLPSTMKDFAFVVHENFPYIIDTKHLIIADPEIQLLMKKKSRSLSSVFSLLCSAVSSSQNIIPGVNVMIRVEADDEVSSCFNSGSKHEAGYDALMTGSVFAQLCSHIGVKFELSGNANLALHDKVKNYVNFLYPSWNSGTVLNVSSGEENEGSGYNSKYPPVSYENTVLIWRFPVKLKANDVKDCICEALGLDSVTSVFSIDPTAILVQFSRGEFLDDFFTLKESLEKSTDVLLHPLSVLLEGGQTCASTYEAYAEICASPVSKYIFADQADAVGMTQRIELFNSSIDSQDLSGYGEDIADGALSQQTKQLQEKKPGCKMDSGAVGEHLLDFLLASK